MQCIIARVVTIWKFNLLLLMYIQSAWHNMLYIHVVVSTSEINVMNQYEYIISVKASS